MLDLYNFTLIKFRLTFLNRTNLSKIRKLECFTGKKINTKKDLNLFSFEVYIVESYVVFMVFVSPLHTYTTDLPTRRLASETADLADLAEHAFALSDHLLYLVGKTAFHRPNQAEI